MSGGATAALLVRALISLALVTGLILGGFVVIRRRRDRPVRSSMTRQARPARTLASARGAQRGLAVVPAARHKRNQLVVLSRINTSRTSVISAVQFGERVLLVASTEQHQAQLLAEMPLDEWDAPEQEQIVAIDATVRSTGGSLIEALRSATARHA